MRQARALAVMAMGIVAVGSLALLAPGASVDWRGQWLVAVLLGGATAFGALHVFAADEPQGVPLQALITPALAAVAIYAAVPLVMSLGVHPAIALVVALGGGLILVSVSVEAEVPFVRLGYAPTAADRRFVEALLLGSAFLIFGGVAATLPGGWAHVELDLPGQLLPESAPALGLADAAVALLVGYRLVAIAGQSAVGWVTPGYAVLLGLASIGFRWLAIPGFLAAALLTLVLHLRASLPRRSLPVDGSARWRLEALVIALVILVVVGYQLFGR